MYISTCKICNDTMERGHTSLAKVNRYWNIPFNLIFVSLQWLNQNKENGSIRCVNKKIRLNNNHLHFDDAKG